MGIVKECVNKFNHPIQNLFCKSRSYKHVAIPSGALTERVRSHYRIAVAFEISARERNFNIFGLTESAAICSSWFLARGLFKLKMEAICSFETSVHTKYIRRHIPEDGILHSHGRDNLKSHILT
jgi:hypothetical protein